MKNELIKVPEIWKIYTLNNIYDYVKTHGYANTPYPKKVKKAEDQILNFIKVQKKKNIKISSIEKIIIETNKQFKEKKILGPITGPTGDSYGTYKGLFLDLNDIEDVYISKDKYETIINDKIDACDKYGVFKSKTCGWVGWIIANITKKDATTFLVSFNHFKKETAMSEVFSKLNKYNDEKVSRRLQKFFISNRFWYHDDLENLNKALPYTPFLNY